MTALAAAIEQSQWEVVSLYLLLGVSRAAAALPPDAIDGLLEELEASPAHKPGPQERRGPHRGTRR